MPGSTAPPDVRLWRRTVRRGPDDCWLWSGAVNKHGYGTLTIDHRPWLVHRFSYLIAHLGEQLPPVLDHMCHTTECKESSPCSHRRCVNPAHLQPSNRVANNLRGNSLSAENKRKTHCIRGHRFEGANLRVTPKGYRDCRECQRIRNRKSFINIEEN